MTTSPRRTFVGVRLGPELDTIETLAEQETAGNLSEMIRRLLLEALTQRALNQALQAREHGRPTVTSPE